MTQPTHLGDPAPAPDSPAGEMVPASTRDRPLNLAFEVYRPIRPFAGKIRGENLLWHSLLHGGCLDAWDDALHAVQRERGRDRTVWGLHYDMQSGALAWELRVLSPALAALRATLAPWFSLAPGVELEPETCAMLGFRFDAQTRASVPALELHLRDAKDSRSFVVERRAGEAETESEVISRDLVREPKRDIDDVLPAVKASAVVDFDAHPQLLGRVMIPELYACRRLHISKRAGRDALCFSGVNVEQLAFAYKRFELPAPLTQFLTGAQAELEHLLFDVSVEYRAVEDRVDYPAVAIYGCL